MKPSNNITTKERKKKGKKNNNNKKQRTHTKKQRNKTALYPFPHSKEVPEPNFYFYFLYIFFLFLKYIREKERHPHTHRLSAEHNSVKQTLLKFYFLSCSFQSLLPNRSDSSPLKNWGVNKTPFPLESFRGEKKKKQHPPIYKAQSRFFFFPTRESSIQKERE